MHSHNNNSTLNLYNIEEFAKHFHTLSPYIVDGPDLDFHTDFNLSVNPNDC